MGKIGQNPKIGQFWRTIAPQPYVVQERWPALGNSLALEIQRVNSISLQCIPWPVACSEWGACLTLYRCQILGQMTLKVKIFENVFPDSSMRHQTTFRDQIWWKVYERSRGLPNKKNSGSAGLAPDPFCPKWASRAQNSLNVVTPGWPVHVYRIWSGSAAFSRTYSGKIDSSAQKVNTV